MIEHQQLRWLWDAHRMLLRGAAGHQQWLAVRAITRGTRHGATVAVRAFASSLRRRHGIVTVGCHVESGGAA